MTVPGIASGISLIRPNATPRVMTYEGFSSGFSPATTATSWPVDNFDAPQIGSLLVLILGFGPNTETIDGTWNEVAGSPTSPGGGSTQELHCYWKYAVAVEPSAYTWTMGSAVAGGAIILNFRNPHPTNPVDAIAFTSATTSTNAVCPSVSPATSKGFLICAAIAAGTRTLTGPGGDLVEAYNTGSDNPPLFVGVEDLNAAGATGTRTPTISTSANYATMSLVVRGA